MSSPRSGLPRLTLRGNPRERQASALQERLGLRFARPDLLTEALSHRSWCSENEGYTSNERLEFLGDSVLGLVVTRVLFDSERRLPEGEMSKIRAAMVSAPMLAEVGADLGVGEALLLGKGEEMSNGRAKPSLLSDALEALIGAAYLEGGWDVAESLVLRLLAERIDAALRAPAGGDDHKGRLQELAAARGWDPPVYRVTASGPDHARRFAAEVVVAGKPAGSGSGLSKKQAEQAAARCALDRLAGDGTRCAGKDRPGKAVIQVA